MFRSIIREITMMIYCNYCKFEWISDDISRCPNCNSGNIGPHPKYYNIKKIKS